VAEEETTKSMGKWFGVAEAVLLMSSKAVKKEEPAEPPSVEGASPSSSSSRRHIRQPRFGCSAPAWRRPSWFGRIYRRSAGRFASWIAVRAPDFPDNCMPGRWRAGQRSGEALQSCLTCIHRLEQTQSVPKATGRRREEQDRIPRRVRTDQRRSR
jgi:hypothetical protein